MRQRRRRSWTLLIPINLPVENVSSSGGRGEPRAAFRIEHRASDTHLKRLCACEGPLRMQRFLLRFPRVPNLLGKTVYFASMKVWCYFKGRPAPPNLPLGICIGGVLHVTPPTALPGRLAWQAEIDGRFRTWAICFSPEFHNLLVICYAEICTAIKSGETAGRKVPKIDFHIGIPARYWSRLVFVCENHQFDSIYQCNLYKTWVAPVYSWDGRNSAKNSQFTR